MKTFEIDTSSPFAAFTQIQEHLKEEEFEITEPVCESLIVNHLGRHYLDPVSALSQWNTMIVQNEREDPTKPDRPKQHGFHSDMTITAHPGHIVFWAKRTRADITGPTANIWPGEFNYRSILLESVWIANDCDSVLFLHIGTGLELAEKARIRIHASGHKFPFTLTDVIYGHTPLRIRQYVPG